MRVLIISDIHANLNALDAVLAEAGGTEAVWCLGDLVGYGPDPNECIQKIQSLPLLKCIIGNHDLAALDQLDAESFNPEARAAIFWTRKCLSKSSTKFLNLLPKTIEMDSVMLAHGSPRHPVWEYLLDAQTAASNFDFFATPFCFVGHTHLPVVYALEMNDQKTRMTIPAPNTTLTIPQKAILNPGSVGQPRDRDSRASFSIYDDKAKTWEYHRVAYDIEAVQRRMAAAGLPERHIQRLSAGW